MRRIPFSDVGVIVNSLEELEEIYLTYSTLGIPIADTFKQNVLDAQMHNLTGWYIQCTVGYIDTKLSNSVLDVSIIKYPIRYSMQSLDFAVACTLLKSNQEDELKAHLDKYCKECE